MQQPLSPTGAGNGRRSARQQAPPLPSPTSLPEGPGGRTRRGARRQGSAGMQGQQLQQEEPLREQEEEGEEEQQSVHAAAAATAPSPHTPVGLPGPDAPAGAHPKPQRLEKRGAADSGALLEAAGSCGAECVLSPTAVAGGGDAASMTTPGGSAGDVSVQSTQRGSFGEPGRLWESLPCMRGLCGLGLLGAHAGGSAGGWLCATRANCQQQAVRRAAGTFHLWRLHVGPGCGAGAAALPGVTLPSCNLG